MPDIPGAILEAWTYLLQMFFVQSKEEGSKQNRYPIYLRNISAKSCNQLDNTLIMMSLHSSCPENKKKTGPIIHTARQ